MARKTRKRRRNEARRTQGLLLLASIIQDVSMSTFRDIDPNLHLDQEQRNPELTAYNYISRHHRLHKVLPSLEVVADNTGILLPTVDQPADYYFRRVRERALVNHVMEPYNRLQEALTSPRKYMGEMVDSIEELNRIRAKFIDAGTGVETSDSLLPELQRITHERRMSGGSVRGITTGYSELDYEMDGYNPEDLVVWVARPGRSKSWNLLKQCHAAWTAGYKPLYISMEMGGLQNMRRIVGIHSGINPTFIKRGTLQTLAVPYMDRAISELLEQRPLHMVTANFSRTVDQVASFIEEYNPDIVYIDAGYLLSPRKKRYGSSGRRETISDVIEELKQLAGDSGVPFVITVQFNRQAEHRRRASGGDSENFSPISHLSVAEIGETDVIGQVATHVLGIEYPPSPLPRMGFRTFGFLKGREGESGWWLTRFMQSQTSPVQLDIIPRTDPVYDLVRQHAAQQSDGRRPNANSVDPSRRTQLMRINNA